MPDRQAHCRRNADLRNSRYSLGRHPDTVARPRTRRDAPWRSVRPFPGRDRLGDWWRFPWPRRALCADVDHRRRVRVDRATLSDPAGSAMALRSDLRADHLRRHEPGRRPTAVSGGVAAQGPVDRHAVVRAHRARGLADGLHRARLPARLTPTLAAQIRPKPWFVTLRPKPVEPVRLTSGLVAFSNCSTV